MFFGGVFQVELQETSVACQTMAQEGAKRMKVINYYLLINHHSRFLLASYLLCLTVSFSPIDRSIPVINLLVLPCTHNTIQLVTNSALFLFSKEVSRFC